MPVLQMAIRWGMSRYGMIEEINLVKSVVSQAFLSLISMADYAYPWAHPSYHLAVS
jgi:hypothetical protein